MSVSLEKLTELLTECDVSKSDQLKDALARVGQAHADLAAERVVAELTESGVITPLQSELLLAGRNLVLGHYILREKIGEGGMGTVYAARHRHMGRQVALKVIRPDRFKDPGFIERFRREIQLAARLRHTNIVVAYDAGEDHGALYLVMELVEGCDLARHVRRYGALDLPTALDAVRQAACGLAYLHSQKLVHRDIKPSNLLLDRQGVVKILDLGLSRLVEWSEAVQAGVYSTATIPGEPMGSVDFMSPEQFVNARLVDARADLYSLGCTLYGLLTGRPPFPGMSPGERIIAHREHPIPSLRNVVPDAPPGLERLFQRLLAKNPALRPSDANRVIAEIDALGILRSSSGVPAAAIAAEFAETEVFPRAPSATGRMTKSRLIASVCAIVGVALTALAISRYRTVGGDKT
ncbi:MAG TPA: serine/threonine-protein kinase, partial [Pirellulales bacterium]